MNIEQERADFETWYKHHHGDRDVYALDEFGEYVDKQVQGAFNVWQARAALQTQEQSIPYAGVTVWVGDKRCSHGVTKDELELSTFDILQAAFDHARRVEREGE